LHIFEDWCHLETVEDENNLQDDVLASRYHLVFDLDIYRLLERHLNTCTDIISYERQDEHIG
jgi:DNA polymerase-3 subunit epsilon